jgi:hypothetical protein
MQLRHLILPIALLATAACQDDGVSVNARPPLGGVRFINAVADGGPVDIRMYDQVDWSASSVNGTNFGLAFRAGTIHWPTEAKARKIRVFPTDSSIAVTSQILHDTTITIEANKNVTLMLVGSRAQGAGVRFVMIDDSPPQLTGNQIAVRMVNASASGQATAPASGYLTATPTSTLPGSPSFANVGAIAVAQYVVRDTGSLALRVTPPADPATVLASAAAPTGAPAGDLIGVTAGFRGPGSALSAYLFPRSVAGSAAPSSFTTPGIVWFVDRVPEPPTR